MGTAALAAPPVVLSAEGICKTFGNQLALDDVSLILRGGEAHGLVGENGSGKSTMVKILAGYHAPERGDLVVNGHRLRFPLEAGKAERCGLRFVHQDLGMVPGCTVAENFWLNELARGSGTRHLSRRAMERRAHSVLAEAGVDLDPAALVSDLAPVQRELLAIVRAVHGLGSDGTDVTDGTDGADGAEGADGADGAAGAATLVLDEPTVFLPRRDIERVFSVVREICARGAAVLFVSHDLAEVLELCQVVTVLRDGSVVGQERTGDVSARRLVEMMIGRDLVRGRSPRNALPEAAGLLAPAGLPGSPEAVARVREVKGRVVSGVSFDVSHGEILGIAGLAGSGAEELPYLLYGAGPEASGSLELTGKALDLGKLRPGTAIRLGAVLVPGDRRGQGVVGNLSATDNISLPRLEQFSLRGLLRRRAMVADTTSLMDRFDVRPRGPQLDAAMFSGGNQQKVVLAKWLATKPRLLLLHEPTQGVDVGAREQIYDILRRVVADGAAVVCASSDNEQLADLCHRILVMQRGSVVAELKGDQVTKENISDACLASAERP